MGEVHGCARQYGVNTLAADKAVVSWEDKPLRVSVDSVAKDTLRNSYDGGDLDHLLAMWARLIHVAETAEEKARVSREFLKVEEVWAHCGECEPWRALGNYALRGRYSEGWPPVGYVEG